MPIPADVARVSLIGHLPQGEIFNTSFWVRSIPVTDAATANAFAASIRDAFQSSGGSALVSLLAANSGYDEVRVYAYTDGGPTADWIGAAALTGTQGTGTTELLPLQTCMVASLRTGFAGRRSRGRMYLPWIKGLLTTHQSNATLINQVATGVKTFFDAVNALAATGEVCVLSQVVGVTTPVTSVVVDSRPDIQRSHANRQAITSTFTATLA